MKLSELTPEQKLELKQNFLSRNNDVSYGELADADKLVSDQELEEEYGSTEFTADDFFCTAGETVTVWENPDTGLRLFVDGDARHDETVTLTLSRNGTELGTWQQDFTEFDDAGEKLDWSEYAPDAQCFFDDVIDCGFGSEAIPSEITEEEIYAMKPVKWP